MPKVSDPKELRKKAKDVLEQEIEEDRIKILNKVEALIGKESDSANYRKRLNHIYRMLKEKLMLGGDYKKLLRGADFYQRIETFMNYEYDSKDNVIKGDVYDIIGEVFKSLYINFILAYLDDDPVFLPYLGNLKVKEVDRFHPMHKKNIHYIFGNVQLDEQLKRDIRRIDREDKLDIITDVLRNTRKSLIEKVS
jgi:hypothetical protein